MNTLEPLLDSRFVTALGISAGVIIIFAIWRTLFGFHGCKVCGTRKLQNGISATKLIVKEDMVAPTLLGIVRSRGFRLLEPEECLLAGTYEKLFGHQWDFVISKKGNKFFRVMLRSRIDEPFPFSSEDDIRDAIVFITKDIPVLKTVRENHMAEATS